MNRYRQMLHEIWQSGVAAVGGKACVLRALGEIAPPPPSLILAVGKASLPMCEAALEHFGAAIPALVVAKYGHVARTNDLPVRIIEAGHPTPDGNSLVAGAALLEAVAGAGPDDRLVLLISGGASALAEVPLGLTLEEIRAENQRMLAEGLDIHAINARRRSYSRIKGGGLLAAFAGSRADVLAISDVEGDSLAVIGSGIGMCPDRQGWSCQGRVIASNAIARAACARRAAELGQRAVANEEALYGDVDALAPAIARRLIDGPAGVTILGGEPTVHLPPDPGKGGRAQALALALARELDGVPGVLLLVAGTDGTDGPGDAAGAFADGSIWASRPGGAAALARADSGSWLADAGSLFVSGPTGTNVMDLLIAIRD